MSDTSTPAEAIIHDPSASRMRRDQVDAKCADLGATTDEERAALLGMAPATYYRSRREQGCNLSLRIAHRAARRLGWTVEETFEPVRAPLSAAA